MAETIETPVVPESLSIPDLLTPINSIPTPISKPNSKPDSKLSAAQIVLQMPEILFLIFEYISLDEFFLQMVYAEGYPPDFDEDYRDSYDWRGVLFRCGQVNQLWFTEAMPILWSESLYGYFGSCIAKFMHAIVPERRQFYANLIKKASLTTVNSGEGEGIWRRSNRLLAADAVAALKGSKFPRLKQVRLVLDDVNDGFHIPRIENCEVTHLDIDPRFEYHPDTYGMSPDEIAAILEQIPIVFPKLEYVRFVDQAQVKPGALEAFEKRLPCLKHFDHSQVQIVEPGTDLNFEGIADSLREFRAALQQARNLDINVDPQIQILADTFFP